MSGVLNKDILEALCRANFEKITNYILDICELVVEDYEKKQLKLQIGRASCRERVSA